jgi:hypothetical protein
MNNNKKGNNQKIERLIALLTLITLIVASIIGFQRSKSDISDQLLGMAEGATRYESIGFEQYALYNDSSGQAIAQVGMSQFNGFGGPLKVATAVDVNGNITGIVVADHKETPSWFKRVSESQLIPQLKQKRYNDNFTLGEDVDALTGATYTTRAITECVKATSREIAVNTYHLPQPPAIERSLLFGVPELTLIILLLIGTFGIKKANPKNKKRIRWLTMLTGMAVIGFWINHPLTLVDINKLLMGFFPDIYNQLYWYILVFAVLLIFITTKKNVYCNYVCPFGAAQECVALIAKAKNPKSNQLTGILKWMRRLFVWGAIALALIFRNPGFSSYEVYGTFFNLSGTNGAVLFLSIVLVVALFIKRPWCRFLCPIPAFEDYLRVMMKWVKLR